VAELYPYYQRIAQIIKKGPDPQPHVIPEICDDDLKEAPRDWYG
jgi:hypothetical protein